MLCTNWTEQWKNFNGKILWDLVLKALWNCRLRIIKWEIHEWFLLPSAHIRDSTWKAVERMWRTLKVKKSPPQHNTPLQRLKMADTSRSRRRAKFDILSTACKVSLPSVADRSFPWRSGMTFSFRIATNSGCNGIYYRDGKHYWELTLEQTCRHYERRWNR